MLLRILQLYVPAFVKKKVIRELARLTADAFQCKAPDLKGLSYKASLQAYAIFTCEQAQRLIRCGCGIVEVKERLYQAAMQMGKDIRRRLHIATHEQVLMASRIMYRILGIRMHEDSNGGILISQCFFSRYYSGEVCRIISSLDEGVAAALSGGGRLEFHQRITEGGNCCKAHFNVQGELK